MTPTPSSNASSSQHNSPVQDGQFRVIRKRNRIPLSCSSCRSRKLKCNRGHPCDNCIKRGDVDACTYATPAAARKKIQNPPSSSTPDEMQNRIDRLEGLVLSLMTNGPQAPGVDAANAVLAQASTNSMSNSVSGAPSSEFAADTDDTIPDEMDHDESVDESVDKVAKSIGVMKVDSGKNMFISEAHWYTILAEISEVKNYFTENKKQFEDTYKRLNANKDTSGGGGPFFLNAPPTTRLEILRSFPARGTTDVLIARFFELYNFDPSFQIIHGPTYQKQYDRHWMSPHETDTMWIGLTFAMMMLALVSYQRNGDEPPEYRGRTDQMFRDYKRLASQALALTDVGQPVNYMLETLIMYVVADLNKSKDSETTTLLGMTVIVRLAMKMGYHRDSKFFPDVTPFNAEMKRRVWALVKHTDLRVSSQFGLPPMVRSEIDNTEPPRNLYDDELSEDMKVLPASRPINEATPIAYIIYKGQLTDVGLRIIEEVQKLGLNSYDTIMSLNRQLREVQENIPESLRIRPISEAIRDPANCIMKRYILEIMYHKFICLLHRKFAGCPRYPYSNRTSVESAMEILQHQATIFDLQRQGGRLAEARFFLTSLTSHDFLLAAMIVAVDLYRAAEAEKTGRSPSDPLADSNTRASKFTAMEQSLKMWDTVKEESYEALKAVGALSAMMTILRQQEAKLRNNSSPYSAQTFSSNSSASPEDAKLAPEHSAAMTLGMLSSGGALTPNTNPVFSQSNYDAAQAAVTQANLASQYMSAGGDMSNQVQFPSLFMNLFNSVGAIPTAPDSSTQNLDWDAWDSIIHAGNGLDTSMNGSMWPMNLDPAMDPSAATVPTTGVGLSPLGMYMSTPGQATTGAPLQGTANSFGLVDGKMNGSSPPGANLS